MKELKKALDEAMYKANQARERKGRLQEKQAKVYGDLTRLDAEIAAAESAKNDTMARFARDEADEKAIEKARAVLDQVKKRRDDTAELLKAVDVELAGASDVGSFEKAVVKAEAALWRAIAEKEIAKAKKAAAPVLLRAYRAAIKERADWGLSCGFSFEDFLLKELFDPVFRHNAGQEAAAFENDILREYL